MKTRISANLNLNDGEKKCEKLQNSNINRSNMIHVGRRCFIAAVICESFRIPKMSRNGYSMYIFVSPLIADFPYL